MPDPMARPRILITGPGGRVGPHILPGLREHFALRLFDLQKLVPERDDETIEGDIRDFEALRRACEGVSALVHLAAISDEADFHSKLLPFNLAGVYNAFEAARQAGVPKVIFTSTGQTVRFYSRDQWVTPEMPARPLTVYACTKLFGESLARYYADAFELSMICIRLGWFQHYSSPLLKTETQFQREWISPRDLVQLLTKCVQTDVRFAIVFGISNNTGRIWDVSNARELFGYEPQDDIEEHCK